MLMKHSQAPHYILTYAICTYVPADNAHGNTTDSNEDLPEYNAKTRLCTLLKSPNCFASYG